jgi:hypothetical protein
MKRTFLFVAAALACMTFAHAAKAQTVVYTTAAPVYYSQPVYVQPAYVPPPAPVVYTTYAAPVYSYPAPCYRPVYYAPRCYAPAPCYRPAYCGPSFGFSFGFRGRW